MDSHQLIDLCATLNLHAIKESLESRLKQARESKLSYEELLAFLFQDEIECRQQKVFEQKVKQAQFEELKSFDNFDLRRYEDKTIQAIRQIMTGAFLSQKQHVIIMGPVGTGKTHLAQAIGLLACQKGKKVKFVRANELLLEFYRSRADDSWDKLFNRYRKNNVLILDDFGLKSLSAEQSSDLYDLIAAMHITSSLVITTNRKIESWFELFHDPVMANAAMDRIINKAYRIVLEGESYRKKFTPKFDKESDK
jgi:DNA replication protein DnaC